LLTPFDDFPIHPSADPIGHAASGDPNHYDRSFFNGHDRDGRFYIGGAMGHYPNRGVIDGAFCLAIDGMQHSVFASGRMPLDRSTTVGPLRIEILEAMQRIRLVVEANEHDIEADLVFDARTVAVEEPRQHKVLPDGRILTDHTRLTQWGTWEGVVRVDGEETVVDPRQVPGTRDRSWGVRPVGEPTPTNHAASLPILQAFWLWAPLHFDDVCTHLALHEHADGSRWLETGLIVEPRPSGAAPWEQVGLLRCGDIGYELEWRPGRREVERASLSFLHPDDGATTIDLERCFTFHMRGLGYLHPTWGHGRAHGELETARESVTVADLDQTEPTNLHVQTVVKARWGDEVGIGVLEQLAIGSHEPTGLVGLLEGYQP
jgi:hypothetical protein